MASEWNLSSDDSNDLPPMVHSSQKVGGMPTVIVKTEPVTCKSEPVSPDISDAENERNNESELFDTLRNGRYNHPHSSFTSGDFPNIRSGDDGSSTLPHRERSPISNNRRGMLHTATTDRSPYNDGNYGSDDFVPSAMAMAEGLSIRHIGGCLFIPYADVPQRVIFTRPSSIAVSHPDTQGGWIHIPNGLTIDERINRRRSVYTFVPRESPQNEHLPPLPIIDNVPPAIPIDSVPPAIAIDDVPINIKSEIISDDDADNHNMFTDVHNNAATVDVYNEVYTDANNDAYNDIVLEDLEAKENLELRCIESNQEPVVERSESNEESFEKKCIPLVISSSEHFQKEICQKDPCDPTFGDGFQIDRIMKPRLGDDDVFLFVVQWRHQNFAGIDVLRAPIIYDHWPEVALKFYQERYPNDKD